MFSRYACKRYRRLRLDSEDGVLSSRALRFLAVHSQACGECLFYDVEISDMSAAIRSAALEHEGGPEFGAATLRVVLADRQKRRTPTLKPIFAGAATAVIAVGAILQLLSASLNTTASPIGEAQRPLRQDIPLEIDMPGTFNLFDTPSRMVRDPKPFDA
ncbi:MAG: hypothetical protein H0W86_03930 [Armatimonadetes bacterium]|nr:hypothetical protein [Armatimonadota bacterium]